MSDDVAAIAAEAHALSEAFELVITAGGVGPTPDDVTMAGIAAALGVPLIRDPTLEVSLDCPIYILIILFVFLYRFYQLKSTANQQSCHLHEPILVRLRSQV